MRELVCWFGGLTAALSAWAGMAFLRSTLQVRSVPERVVDALLMVLPMGAFEATLQRFGFEAKLYALYGASAGMLLLLAILGGVALSRRWSAPAIVALGMGLWLPAMSVLLPATNAGLFALGLIDGTLASVAGHFAVALTYTATLLLIRSALDKRVATQAVRPPARRLGLGPEVYAPAGPSLSRRSAAVLIGGTAAAYGAAFLGDRLGPRRSVTRVVVRDSVELTPTPAPLARQPDLARSTEPTPRPRPTATVQSWEPPPARILKRDNDGAVLPSGRRQGELADPITSNDDFYVVTKNTVSDPVLRPDDWRLVIDGEVVRPIQLDYASIRRLQSVEITKTLECVSNLVTKCELSPFGCDLMSTARWRGVRVADVLALAGGLKSGVVSLSTISADEYTTSLPIEAALDPETLLVYEMNGQVLPREHGYPLRVLAPGRYGMKNAKWVVALRPMRREFVDWYGQRSWSKEGMVKTMTRVDTPARGATLPAGDHRIAGVAYAGDRGIKQVEFSAAGGERWQVAELLEPPAGKDAWVRWQGRFTLPPGAQLTLVARATDGTGELQPEPFTLPQPDGSTGWHTCEVRAG